MEVEEMEETGKEVESPTLSLHVFFIMSKKDCVHICT